MTNREFYKEQILNIACTGSCVCFNKKTNKPDACNNTPCENCLFQDIGYCDERLNEWANEEHVEIELCEFEKDELVEVSDNEINWSLRYFSHKEGGAYYCFVNGYKSTDDASVNVWNYCRKYGTLGGLVKEE